MKSIDCCIKRCALFKSDVLRCKAGASKIQMGNYVNQTEPAFWFTWSVPGNPNANRGVFHWEFVGISWAGGSDHTLVQFGPKVAWNSCKFEVSNGPIVDFSYQNIRLGRGHP